MIEMGAQSIFPYQKYVYIKLLQFFSLQTAYNHGNPTKQQRNKGTGLNKWFGSRPCRPSQPIIAHCAEHCLLHVVQSGRRFHLLLISFMRYMAYNTSYWFAWVLSIRYLHSEIVHAFVAQLNIFEYAMKYVVHEHTFTVDAFE